MWEWSLVWAYECIPKGISLWNLLFYLYSFWTGTYIIPSVRHQFNFFLSIWIIVAVADFYSVQIFPFWTLQNVYYWRCFVVHATRVEHSSFVTPNGRWRQALAREMSIQQYTFRRPIWREEREMRETYKRDCRYTILSIFISLHFLLGRIKNIIYFTQIYNFNLSVSSFYLIFV